MPSAISYLQLALGLVISSIIAWLAYRRAALTQSGAVGAILTGTAIFGFGGLDWGLLLISFFISSSVLTRYKESAKEQVAEQFAKGGARDLGQALANGGRFDLLFDPCLDLVAERLNRRLVLGRRFLLKTGGQTL